MARILPSKVIVREYELPPEVIIQRLSQHIDARSSFVRSRSRQFTLFEGKITLGSFTIQRLPSFIWNKTPAQISGKITPTEQGSRLNIRYTLNGMEVFGLIILSFWAMIGLAVIVQEHVRSGSGLMFALFPLGVVACAYIYSYINFNISFYKNMQIIHRIIIASSIEETV